MVDQIIVGHWVQLRCYRDVRPSIRPSIRGCCQKQYNYIGKYENIVIVFFMPSITTHCYGGDNGW